MKLIANAALLDDPTVAAAWEFGRLRPVLQRVFAACIVESPKAVARSLRADPTGEAKWVAAVLWVKAQDAGLRPDAGLRTVAFDVPTPLIADRCRLLLQSLHDGPLKPTIDPTSDWLTNRLAAGLSLPRCPQIWLARKQLAAPGA